MQKHSYSKRKLFQLFSLLFSFIVALLVGVHHPATAQNRTEILWDTYGVPHIYGKDTKSLFHAFGWAQMQSHGNLILRLYGKARGRAAQYWGEKYLASDQWVRTMGIPDRARQWYEAQSPKFRADLDAFADGINRYAREHADLIDDEVEAVLPVNAVDLLAHTQNLLHFTFMVNQDHETNYESQLPLGSNAWAIAPSRSASGKAMLLANPHVPWTEPFIWYEAQLTAPEIDAYGATLVGIPVLSIAFNDFLGWSHTVNTHDGWDAYELTLAGKGYSLDGQIRAFEIERQTLKVKQNDGTFQEKPLIVRHSVHGPVVTQTDGKTVGLRAVGLDRSGLLEQWWDMARATNLTAFETALKRLQLPMFTVMYADRDGNIMHLFNGQVPVRGEGDFEFWSGYIPGNQSATLWTKLHPYEDLPRVLNPKSGWLQNANDPPWTTTFPVAIDPNDYPSYMAPRQPMQFRAQRSAQMLAEDDRISFEEMVQYKHSTLMELADRLLDDLIPVARQQGSGLTRRAANVLETWNRKADADSRGAVLFAFWVQQVDLSKLFAIPWSQESPYSTPDGLADPKGAVAALETAAAKVEAAYGALDVPWGKVFRLQQGDVNLPASGGSDQLGIFRVLNFAPTSEGRFRSIQGDSYVAAIEFSNPVRARVINSYGNATQPGSPHMSDQLALLARNQLRLAWRSRKDIMAHLASQKVF